MIIQHPPATVTLTSAEFTLAVERFLAQREPLPQGLRLGNLVDTDLHPVNPLGSPRAWLTGNVTFELLPESK